MEVSAKTSEHIEDAFHKIAQMLVGNSKKLVLARGKEKSEGESGNGEGEGEARMELDGKLPSRYRYCCM